MFDLLEANGLSTVSDCQDQIPIIVQSFEKDALEAFSNLSDLPLIFLTSHPDDDWESLSTWVHGIGPTSALIMAGTDDKSALSPLIETLHSLDLAVHPYTLQDDNLKYMSTAF